MKITKKSIALGLLLVSTTACSEYWWTRGQPPSSQELFERKSLALIEAQKMDTYKRSDLVEISELVHSSLEKAINARSNKPGELQGALQETAQHFLSLEGKLSIGSRAAFGELNGQLRSFLNQASATGTTGVNKPALVLFSARTLSLLSNELSVPAPNFG
jgi:hypothetical protein